MRLCLQLILTNAHVVVDYTTVRIRKHGGAEKFAAEVLYINQCCDLALLTVKDETFWQASPHRAYVTTCSLSSAQDLPALDIAPNLPEVYDNVMVIGYPFGGDNICVTRSIVPS